MKKVSDENEKNFKSFKGIFKNINLIKLIKSNEFIIEGSEKLEKEEEEEEEEEISISNLIIVSEKIIFILNIKVINAEKSHYILS